jgi:hypothetical protein
MAPLTCCSVAVEVLRMHSKVKLLQAHSCKLHKQLLRRTAMSTSPVKKCLVAYITVDLRFALH